MKRRVSAVVGCTLAFAAVVFLLIPNFLQGQPFQRNRIQGTINTRCATTNLQIFQLASGTCPPVTIDIRNTGNCVIELVFRCVGQETARFGPQPLQRVTQTFPADEILVNCQEGPDERSRCRGVYTITW